MKYNTARKPLIFSEYGRGIQEMVDHVLTIPDKAIRTKAAQSIIRSMQALHPQVRDMEDYMHKIYDQLFIMSDYQLDIDSPYPMPVRDIIKKRSKPVQYHPTPIRFRYYGKTLEAMIHKATEMPDGDEKDAVLNFITVQMKKSYYLWNDDILSDTLVANHLAIISDGKLQYTDAMKGEVYSTFYNKPSLERKNKFINVSAYETTNKRTYNNNYNGNNNNNNNNNNNSNNNNGNNNYYKYKKRKSF